MSEAVQAAPPAEAAPSATEPSQVKSRLMAAMFPAKEAAPKEPEAVPATSVARPPVAKPAEAQKPAEAAPADDVEGSVDDEAEAKPEAQEDAGEEQTYETLSDLAEALGWDADKLFDLEATTKIDGKEGKVKIRDALKSYQLEGHLNQKLGTFADEKKAFESERQRVSEEIRAKVQYLDQAYELANRVLHTDYASIDWEGLKNSDPVAYNAKVVEFQSRQQQIRQLADGIGQERARFGEEDAKSQATRFAEEQRLLETKIPEWADKAVAQKDIKAMAEVLESAYGITQQEVMSLTDHRMILAARDAYKWQQLQKSKPALLNKVKAAPKLLKPGSPQSRSAQNQSALVQQAAKFKQTGSKRDGAALFKSILFKPKSGLPSN